MSTSVLVGTVMTTEVVTVRADQTVREAAALLLSEDVDAAPVVDEAGHVLGMLSTGDLIVQETQVQSPPTIAILGVLIPLRSPAHFQAELHKVLGSTVADVMTDEPVVTSPDATIGDAAASMMKHHVSRLPVLDADGILQGIIGRADIVRVLLADLGPA